MNALTRTALLAALALLAAVPAAQAARPHHRGRMVAYDAKDKRYYSVTYAKAHGMRDKGGDPLTVVPLSSLPREAKMSRAMHGHL
jgi:hypothetical protein